MSQTSSSPIALAEAAAAAATAAMATTEPMNLDQARSDIARALEAAPADLKVLFLAFQFYFRSGDLEGAERAVRRRLEVALPESEHAARAYCNLGVVLQFRGQLDEAEANLTRALEIDRRLNNLEGIARDLGNLALVPEARGELDRAEALYLEGLAIARTLTGPVAEEIAAGKLSNLGDIARARGQTEKARALWAEGKAMFDRLGVTKWNKSFAERRAWLETRGAQKPE